MSTSQKASLLALLLFAAFLIDGCDEGRSGSQGPPRTLSLPHASSGSSTAATASAEVRSPIKVLLEKVAASRKEYEAAAKQFDAEREKHPIFTAYGNIVDRDKDDHWVKLWGQAWSNDDSIYGTLLTDSNILIKNPHHQNFQGPIYDSDQVFLIEKTTGTNKFGVSVPVWVYTTDRPKSFAAAELRYNEAEVKDAAQIEPVTNARMMVEADLKKFLDSVEQLSPAEPLASTPPGPTTLNSPETRSTPGVSPPNILAALTEMRAEVADYLAAIRLTHSLGKLEEVVRTYDARLDTAEVKVRRYVQECDSSSKANKSPVLPAANLTHRQMPSAD